MPLKHRNSYKVNLTSPLHKKYAWSLPPHCMLNRHIPVWILEVLPWHVGKCKNTEIAKLSLHTSCKCTCSEDCRFVRVLRRENYARKHCKMVEHEDTDNGHVTKDVVLRKKGCWMIQMIRLIEMKGLWSYYSACQGGLKACSLRVEQKTWAPLKKCVCAQSFSCDQGLNEISMPTTHGRLAYLAYLAYVVSCSLVHLHASTNWRRQRDLQTTHQSLWLFALASRYEIPRSSVPAENF